MVSLHVYCVSLTSSDTHDLSRSKLVWPPSAEAERNPETGVSLDVLQRVGRASVAVPDGFEIHPRLQRHVKARLGAIEKGEGVDWATAEVRALLLPFRARS